MSESYSLTDGPAELEELVTRASRRHEQVNLIEDGETIAVVVPLAEFQALQRLEDEADIAEAEAIKQQGEWISHEDALRILEIGAPDPS